MGASVSDFGYSDSAAVSHCIVSAICISSLMRCQIFGPLSNQVTFLLLRLKVLCVLGNSPLSCVLFASIFSKSVACLLVIFHREEITDFNQVQLINYFFLGLCLWCCTLKDTFIPKLSRFFSHVIF